MLLKIGKERRLTIPPKVMNELELNIGDLVEVDIHPVEVRRKI